MRAKKPYQKKPKRIGRGIGSGHGKTSTKGHKGQRARSGFHQRPTFEGGQTPIHQKFPKRGFNHPEHKSYAILNLDQLDGLKLSEVSPDLLLQNGIIRNLRDGLKILGRGKLAQKLTVQAHRFSESAKEAIEKAGGKAILIEQK
ncbi:MAG: 50S ribosomal protein L15 [Candidatus Omnitrophica bacterium]|nr:50S ribosomal protein L15 [Candidatus Omnitrophota bacterium]